MAAVQSQFGLNGLILDLFKPPTTTFEDENITWQTDIQSLINPIIPQIPHEYHTNNS